MLFRFLIAVIICVGFSTNAYAQQDPSNTGNMTSTDATVVLILPSGVSSVTVTISNSFSATALFEFSPTFSGSDFTAMPCVDETSGVLGTSTTSTGTFICSAAGRRRARVRANPFSSGTITATILGGSGAGAVTLVRPIAATQSGTWNITNVSGTVSLPTGAATESTLSGVLTSTTFNNAFGTAGTADSQVLSVQGIASGTALTIAGTVTANLSTVDNAVLDDIADGIPVTNAGTFVVQENGNLLTSAQATEVAAEALAVAMGEVQETPTEFTLLDRLKTVAEAIAGGLSGTIGSGAGVTSPTLFMLGGEQCDNPQSESGPADGLSGWVCLVNKKLPVVIYGVKTSDGTEIEPHPCTGTKTPVTIALTTSGTTQLLALDGSDLIYVCGFDFTATAAVGFRFSYGTGTNCATGLTHIGGVREIVAGAGMMHPATGMDYFTVPAGNALCGTLDDSQLLNGVAMVVQEPAA